MKTKLGTCFQARSTIQGVLMDVLARGAELAKGVDRVSQMIATKAAVTSVVVAIRSRGLATATRFKEMVVKLGVNWKQRIARGAVHTSIDTRGSKLQARAVETTKRLTIAFRRKLNMHQVVVAINGRGAEVEKGRHHVCQFIRLKATQTVAMTGVIRKVNKRGKLTIKGKQDVQNNVRLKVEMVKDRAKALKKMEGVKKALHRGHLYPKPQKIKRAPSDTSPRQPTLLNNINHQANKRRWVEILDEQYCLCCSDTVGFLTEVDEPCYACAGTRFKAQYGYILDPIYMEGVDLGS